MQSKTSSSDHKARVGCFLNGTLFRNNLGRYWPLWLVYGIAWLILMPLTQFSALHGATQDPTYYDMAERILNTGIHGGLWMSLSFSVLFAMAMFSYLYTAHSIGLMHTLPIRRESLFLTNYLSGLFMQISVLLLTALLTAAAQITRRDSFVTGKELGIWLVLTVCMTLFFYSFATFCAMFTGQILALPVFYGILCVLTAGLDWLVRTFSGMFLYGISAGGGFSAWALWLSPAFRLSQKLTVDFVWDEHYEKTIGYTLEGLPTVLIYGACSVVFLALALLVYRHRRSESAGDTVSISWARPIFKYGVAVCAALGLGQGLYLLTWGQYCCEGNYSLPGVLVCMLLSGLLGYYAAEMLLKKSFHVFRSSWRGAVLLIVALAAFGIITSMDLFGLETRVPSADDVENVHYDISCNDYLSGSTKDPALIQQLCAIHAAVIEDKNEQQSRGTETASGDDSPYTFCTLDLTYTLKNGKTLNRSYSLYLLSKDLNGDGAMALLNRFCSEPEVQKTLLFNDAEILGVTSGEYDYYGKMYQTFQLDQDESTAIYQAVLEDAAAGRFNVNFMDYDDYQALQYYNAVGLWLKQKNGTGQSVEYYSIPLNKNCTATVAALEKLGVVTSEYPLLTNQEYDERYGEKPEDSVAYDKMETSAAEAAASSAETGAMTVIGGADGPTSVFVSGGK